MNNTEFEAQLRAGEQYHGLRIPPDQWIIIRVDGHGFSRFTATHYQKPFDIDFHQCMTATAQTLLEELGGLYAYTESDEISILLPLQWSLFDRSVEKTVSLSAGLASSAFTLASGKMAHFDSRIWLGAAAEQVVDYFRWRQSDAIRCALNGWCYWTLRQQGYDVKSATRTLERQSLKAKHELLQQYNIDFEQVPAWQQNGIGLYWENFEKVGFDPIKQETIAATRRRIKVDTSLPTGTAYSDFLLTLLNTTADVAE